MYFKSEIESEVAERSVFFGVSSLYIEVETPERKIYGVAPVRINELYALVMDTLEQAVESDGYAKIGVGYISGGKGSVIVSGSLTRAEVAAFVDKGINAAHTLTSALTDQLFGELVMYYTEGHRKKVEGM